MHDYTLTRISEDEDFFYCSDDSNDPNRVFPLSKDKCRLVQGSYLWDRKLPDTVILRIPNEIADRFNLDPWED